MGGFYPPTSLVSPSPIAFSWEREEEPAWPHLRFFLPPFFRGATTFSPRSMIGGEARRPTHDAVCVGVAGFSLVARNAALIAAIAAIDVGVGARGSDVTPLHALEALEGLRLEQVHLRLDKVQAKATLDGDVVCRLYGTADPGGPLTARGHLRFPHFYISGGTSPRPCNCFRNFLGGGRGIQLSDPQLPHFLQFGDPYIGPVGKGCRQAAGQFIG